jgi:hypothetical protein
MESTSQALFFLLLWFLRMMLYFMINKAVLISKGTIVLESISLYPFKRSKTGNNVLAVSMGHTDIPAESETTLLERESF